MTETQDKAGAKIHMGEMPAVSPANRRVVNWRDGTFQPFLDASGAPDGEVLQLNPNHAPGYGFHLYRMAPGYTTVAHTHKGDEEFFVLEGELLDHDGFRYRAGDLVWLKAGTQHHSYSPEGALLVVYYRGAKEDDMGEGE